MLFFCYDLVRNLMTLSLLSVKNQQFMSQSSFIPVIAFRYYYYLHNMVQDRSRVGDTRMNMYNPVKQELLIRTQD